MIDIEALYAAPPSEAPPSPVEIEDLDAVPSFELPLARETPTGDGIPILTEEELGVTFTELSEIAANQPESSVALEGLRQLVTTAWEQGNVGAALQMAATIGAMACTHPHMESLANEVMETVFGSGDHGKKDKKSPNDDDGPGSCELCNANKFCSRHKR